MVKLQGRKTDELGQVVFDEKGIIDLMYSGDQNIGGLLAEPGDDIDRFNKFSKMFDAPDDALEIYEDLNISKEEFDKALTSDWLMPDQYKKIDLDIYFAKKCKTDIEFQRVELEIGLFRERGLSNLLRFLIYLVDWMRENKVVWGVGRGSSIASYLLFLIGIHKIDPIKYELDIIEFLK